MEWNGWMNCKLSDSMLWYGLKRWKGTLIIGVEKSVSIGNSNSNSNSKNSKNICNEMKWNE